MQGAVGLAEHAGLPHTVADHPSFAGRHLSGAGHLSGGDPINDQIAATCAFIVTTRGAERSETRCGLNRSAHGVGSRPLTRSARIAAAMVPPLSPHFMKPEATETPEDIGVYRPIIGS